MRSIGRGVQRFSGADRRLRAAEIGFHLGESRNLVLENRDIRAMVESHQRPAIRQVANGRFLFFGSEGSFSKFPCTSINDEGLR